MYKAIRKTIFHLVRPAVWLEVDDLYSPDSLIDEGFIHCSDKEQILASANRHFSGDLKLLVLALDTQNLKSKLVFEKSPNREETYPHIYGPIYRDEVLAIHSLERKKMGEPFTSLSDF